MDNQLFKNWLKEEKNMGEMSSRDVISRINRILRILQTQEIDDNTAKKLLESKEYQNASSCVKSQLKRATILYLEFRSKQK